MFICLAMVPDNMTASVYSQAQQAIAILKSCIYQVLEDSGNSGLRNADISTKLGVRTADGNSKDWITRTVLGMMEREEVVEKVNNLWYIK
jgi:hypothetical protein